MNLPSDFKNDDILLVADYGRSAQGWLSYMLSYILNARFIEPYNLLNGKKYTSSSIIEHNTKGSLEGRQNSRYKLIVKTHLHPGNPFNLTNSIIYLTRDPRDVAISYYYLRRNSKKAKTDSIKDVFLHTIPIISYFITAFRWKRHFRKWEDISCFRLRYEDLRAETFIVMSAIFKHFEIDIEKNLILESINKFSFENTYSRKRGVEDINNSEARKGQIGDYRNHFTGFINIIFWAICGKEAELCGYKFNGSTTIELENRC